MEHYYAQRKAVKNGQPQTPANYPYNTPEEAERQYYLLCASAIANNDGFDVVSVEYGSIENGAISHRSWIHKTEAPESE